MKELKRILDATSGISAYRISENSRNSYELFFVHEYLETVRSTDTVDTDVTVYVEHDGAIGDSTFHVYASMTEDDIKEKIKTAASRAMLVSNQPYTLPEGGQLEAELPTDLDKYEPEQLGKMIADAVFSADHEEGCSINALEIFIYKDTARVVNSRGVDKKQTSFRVMIEAIPTFTDGDDSVELYEDYRFTEFNAEKLRAEIAEKMKEVADRAKAVKPEGGMTVNVLLRPHEISELLYELSRDCNYQTIYSHANLHSVGDKLQNGDCDRLNVTMKAVVEGSERSAFFDEDGASLHDTVIIRDGEVCGSFGTTRFGQYLGVKEPSGSLRCASVGAGTLEDEQIKEKPYLDVVSMSGLQLDLYNDYIGGEIRLAYLFDGEKTTPVTGISMSAKLSEALDTMRLSRKTDVNGPYEGPVRLLLKDITVL